MAAVYTIAPFVRTADDLIRELRPDTAPSPGPAPRPEGKRVWASLAKEPEEVIDEAFLDAASRDPKRAKSWVVLVDGHVDQLARVRAAARTHRVKITIVLDLIHVLEYLWKAAYVFHPGGLQRGRTLGDRAPAVAAVRRCRAGHRLDSPDRHVPRADGRRAQTGGYLCRLHRTLQSRTSSMTRT